MALLGKGVAAIWHDIAPEAEADYHHWHCHEHIPERIGVPGFLRGRRYVGVSGEPQFFHFYETRDLATLTSPEYLARLDDPTPWTRRVVPHFRGNNRTLAEVVCSRGLGGGAAILTLRARTAPGRESDLGNWFCGQLSGELVKRPGLIAAHLLRGDPSASGLQTEEKAMRERPDDVAAWVLLIEALEPALLTSLRESTLADEALTARGVTDIQAGIYSLHFTLSAEELP